MKRVRRTKRLDIDNKTVNSNKKYILNANPESYISFTFFEDDKNSIVLNDNILLLHSDDTLIDKYGDEISEYDEDADYSNFNRNYVGFFVCKSNEIKFAELILLYRNGNWDINNYKFKIENININNIKYLLPFIKRVNYMCGFDYWENKETPMMYNDKRLKVVEFYHRNNNLYWIEDALNEAHHKNVLCTDIGNFMEP